MKYRPYEAYQLHQLVNEPQEIADRPYMLHASYALSCLYEGFVEEDDYRDYEDEEDSDDEDLTAGKDRLWGLRIPVKTLNSMLRDICNDFIDSAANYKPIQVWGKRFNIRKTNAFDRDRLTQLFNFPVENDEYVITKEGVLDLAGVTPTALEQYETSKEEARVNREYFRKIVTLAEDDAIDGWDKLTDMEVVFYCWGLFYNKTEMENLPLFLQDYKDYIVVDAKEIISCFDTKSAFRGCPIGMYPFSAEKIESWNTEHRQYSKAKEISAERANDYWYEVALNNTFKKG